MSNLLQVIRWTKSATSKGIPAFMEFTVSPEAGPFLVTSSTGLYWRETIPGTLLRAAVRDVSAPGDLFREVVESVIHRSITCEWGSVQPYTPQGLQEAVSYLESYDIMDLELLVPEFRKDLPPWMAPDVLDSILMRTTTWLPKGTAVLVPQNRDLIGCLVHLTPKQVVAAIHNPSRGLAFLRA